MHNIMLFFKLRKKLLHPACLSVGRSVCLSKKRMSKKLSKNRFHEHLHVGSIDRYLFLNNSPRNWGIELSSTTPQPREDSILSLVETPTPTHSPSPFWTNSSHPTTPQLLEPSSIVEAIYSQGSASSSRHGPTVYFSKKLRQKIMVSRGIRRNDRSSSSSNRTPRTFSPQIQRLVATEIEGIARLNESNRDGPARI